MPNLFTPERGPAYKARRNQARGRAQAIVRGVYRPDPFKGASFEKTVRRTMVKELGRRQAIKVRKADRRISKGLQV